MCKFSGGGIGGILGGLAGTLLGGPVGGFLGSELGGTIGGVASGEDAGKAALGALPGAAISGVAGAAGNLISGGDLGLSSGLLTGGTGGVLGELGGFGSPSAAAATGEVGSSITPVAATGGGIGLPGSTAPIGTAAGAGASPLGITAATGAGGSDVTGALSGGSVADGSSIALGDFSPRPTADSGIGGLGGRALAFIKDNPALAIGGGGLLASMMMNNSIPGLGNLSNQAKLLSTQGNEAAGALRTGMLPPGAQASLDKAAEAAKATIRSHYGSLGLTGSTMESQAMSSIDQNAAEQKFDMLQKMTEMGLREIGAANDLFKTIMTTELSQDQHTQDAVARIAAALAGGGVARAAAA